uniref:Leukocyte receptor cluster member 9 n=1 Tax=Acanthochromis polyacanthus TaxID=80966 RepID=A0A3Q1F646_9TELE
TDSAEVDVDGVKVCQFFLMGKCRFGQRCRLSHRCVRIKAAEVNKKPRMRTADDVISRILWDPSVEASDFVVGYVDRFLGVLERPFSEFNWDTDPCDCDYASELALPRHRIQYFTYRGHRVWDRHTRTDRVFGSTGQPVAPPFGREEEEEAGETLLLLRLQMECEDPEEAEQLPPEQDGGETETDPKHLEEDEKNETNVQPQESAADRSEFILYFFFVFLDFGKLWLPHNFQSLRSPPVTQNPSVPLEKRGGRPPKKRPTHFVCFRANTPSILSCFQQLQEDVVALLPDSAPYWRPASSLHVTLCLLVLRGPDQVASAGEILRRFAQLDRNPPVSVTFPVKLKHFSGRVLYLSPQPQLHLQQLNAGLQDAFRTDGLLHRDSFNPRYHLTLAKLDRPDADRLFEGVADLKAGKSLNFGRLPVNTLHLCEMGGANVDGFYRTLSPLL